MSYFCDCKKTRAEAIIQIYPPPTKLEQLLQLTKQSQSHLSKTTESKLPAAISISLYSSYMTAIKYTFDSYPLTDMQPIKANRRQLNYRVQESLFIIQDGTDYRHYFKSITLIQETSTF